MGLEVKPGLVVPDVELEWRFSTSSGPGGQHANKASTRVHLTWDMSSSTVLSPQQRNRLIDKLGETVSVVVDDERSQLRNRGLARDRLAARVRAALHVDRPRRATKPSRGSKERRLKGKRRNSENKKLRQRPRRDD